MSSKTKIVVLHMKEVIYTAIFLVLAILLLVLLFTMFGTQKKSGQTWFYCYRSSTQTPFKRDICPHYELYYTTNRPKAKAFFVWQRFRVKMNRQKRTKTTLDQFRPLYNNRSSTFQRVYRITVIIECASSVRPAPFCSHKSSKFLSWSDSLRITATTDPSGFLNPTHSRSLW